MMIKIIIIIVALLAGLILAPDLSANKGYLLVSVDGYTTYETTIINALLIALTFYLLLILVEWVLRKLFSMNSLTRTWFTSRKTKKAQKNNLLGMQALFEGNDKQAHKLLEKSAPRSEAPALTYIAAARAAHNQGNYEQRDQHLQRVLDGNDGSQLAAGLAWAELQIDAQQYQEALHTLAELQAKFPKKPKISALYLAVYPALGQWQNYIALLNSKSNILTLTDAEKTQCLELGYQHVFREKANEGGDVLALFWDKQVPRWMRKELNYQKLLLNAQIDAGNDTFAASFLLDKLKKQFSVDFLIYVDRLQLDDYSALILLLENKLAKDPDNGLLHQTLAHLQAKEGKADSAIKHLQESVKTDPNVKDFALLADLLEQQERGDEANEYYRLGLLLATAEG